MLHKVYVNKSTGRVTKNPARNSEPVWFACKSLTTVEWYTGLILDIDEYRDASSPRHQHTEYSTELWDETTSDKYIIYYDYTDDCGYECCNCKETFYGDWFELQECIKTMRRNGCYNIDAVACDQE